MPGSPRSPPGSKIYLTKVGSGRGKQYLFTGVKLRYRSLGHLEGGPNPEQQPQKPECAPLRSSPASGRGMEAAPRLSHSVVLRERQQRLRCCGCCYCWQKAEKKGREVHSGRMQGAGLASVTSLRLRRGRPSFLLPPSSSPPTHVALATASSFPPRGWVRDHALLCRSPAGRHGSRRRWRALRETARARGLQPAQQAGRGRVKNAVETSYRPTPPNSRFPLLFRVMGHI